MFDPVASGRGGFGSDARGTFRGSRGRPEPIAEASDEVLGAQMDGNVAHRRRTGFRGRRGGAPGAPSFGRREFDRHSAAGSAVGRGREPKKQGAGGHNWGHEEAENHPVKTETTLTEDSTTKEPGSQVAPVTEVGMYERAGVYAG